MQDQPTNPLHGVTLEQIINALVDRFGWEQLSKKIAINCFRSDPTVKSSLSFLRKTPWAREKVEMLYIKTCCGPIKNNNPWTSALKKTKKTNHKIKK